MKRHNKTTAFFFYDVANRSTLLGVMKIELQASTLPQSHEPILDEHCGQESLPLRFASICDIIHSTGSTFKEALASGTVDVPVSVPPRRLAKTDWLAREYSRPPALSAQ